MSKIVALCLAAALAGACSKSKGRKSAPATTVVAPTPGVPVLEKPLDNKSVLVIGNKYLAATKTEAVVAGGAPDAALNEFQAELYPKLKTYCGTACHSNNAFPFASAGAPLAYQTAKKYMTANPDDSKMIQNIKAGHNGVDPAIAAELAPMIKKVAAELAKQGG